MSENMDSLLSTKKQGIFIKNKNYKKLSQKFLSRFARTIASQYDKNYLLRYQNCSSYWNGELNEYLSIQKLDKIIEN